MTDLGRHRVLEARLHALVARIEEAKLRLAKTPGADRIEAFGEIKELEGRHRKLTARLSHLEREGPGLRQDMKAELEALADDLSGAVEDFMIWVDSGYAIDRRPAPRAKS